MLEPLWQGLPPIDPSAVSGSASLALPPQYESVGGARRFTRVTLQGWELADLFDSVALVVSELVTNAMRHGLPDGIAARPASGPDGCTGSVDFADAGNSTGAAGSAGPTGPAGSGDAGGFDPRVRLHLMRWSSRLVCAVRDPSRESPVAMDADAIESCGDSAESGRGLFLVDSFADSWGWQPLTGSLGGKVVWALFRLPPGTRQL
ncbi:ATP-binding protein [Streptomyces sp. H27-D2]|nr:ATP-binding protein [Streptomyces sp. H27-D2]MEC4018216.1 ATP-binding protein [Streptomyces sp. H27-D2]